MATQYTPSGGGRHALGKELYLPKPPETPAGAGPALVQYATLLAQRWTGFTYIVQEFARQIGTVVARETIQKAGSRIPQSAITVTASPFTYCVSPETLVLTSDLRWVRADVVKVGDHLVGPSEGWDGGGRLRKLRDATVEAVNAFYDRRVRVWTARGDIVVNRSHPFLVVKKGRRRSQRWILASGLVPGDEIKFIASPWADRSDSWLAGIIDGEGFLNGYKHTNVGISQKPGPVFDRIKREVSALGIADRHICIHHGKGASQLIITSLGASIKVLGSCRPIRLLGRFTESWLDGRFYFPQAEDKAFVLAVEEVGVGEVVGIQTSTRTLITNGFVSHNTNLDGTIETVYVVGGTVSQIVFTRLGTNTTFTTLPQTFILSPNDLLVVTYTGAPTMVKVLF